MTPTTMFIYPSGNLYSALRIFSTMSHILTSCTNPSCVALRDVSRLAAQCQFLISHLRQIPTTTYIHLLSIISTPQDPPAIPMSHLLNFQTCAMLLFSAPSHLTPDLQVPISHPTPDAHNNLSMRAAYRFDALETYSSHRKPIDK